MWLPYQSRTHLRSLAELTILVLFGMFGMLGLHPAAHLAAASPLMVTPVNVRVDAGTFPAYAEPALAEQRDDSRDLVGAAKMFSDPAHYVFRIGTFYSTDGGTTWRDNGPLPGLRQFEVTSDVEIATAPHKSVYVSVVAADVHHGQATGVYVYHSADGGVTYSQPLTVTTHTYGGDDKDQLAVDNTGGPHNGTVYLTWCYAPGGRHDHIRFASSHDGGQTWTILPAIDAGVARAAQFAQPVVGPDGTVYVTFVDLVTNVLYVTSSGDGGLTFRRPWQVARFMPPPDRLIGGFRAAAIPSTAVAPTGTLLVAWNDYRTGDSDILVSISTTQGRTWQGPYRLNDDYTRTDQFQPAVVALADGSFAISYFDRATDPAHNLLVAVTAARFQPGRGATYVHVSNLSFDPTRGGIMVGRHMRFLGDYQGLSAGPREIHLLWNDTRDGTFAMPSTHLYSAVVPLRLFATQTPRPIPLASPLPSKRRPMSAPGPHPDAG